MNLDNIFQFIRTIHPVKAASIQVCIIVISILYAMLRNTIGMTSELFDNLIVLMFLVSCSLFGGYILIANEAISNLPYRGLIGSKASIIFSGAVILIFGIISTGYALWSLYIAPH